MISKNISKFIAMINKMIDIIDYRLSNSKLISFRTISQQ